MSVGRLERREDRCVLKDQGASGAPRGRSEFGVHVEDARTHDNALAGIGAENRGQSM